MFPQSYVIGICILVYVSANTVGLMTLPGLLMGELLPQRARGIGGGCTFFVFNLSLFGVTKLFPLVSSTDPRFSVQFTEFPAYRHDYVYSVECAETDKRDRGYDGNIHDFRSLGPARDRLHIRRSAGNEGSHTPGNRGLLSSECQLTDQSYSQLSNEP